MTPDEEDVGGATSEDCTASGTLDWGGGGAAPEALPDKHEYAHREAAKREAYRQTGDFIAKVSFRGLGDNRIGNHWPAEEGDDLPYDVTLLADRVLENREFVLPLAGIGIRPVSPNLLPPHFVFAKINHPSDKSKVFL
jgi:hypothetical protein